MTDAELENMSVRDLRDLRLRVDEAIRAQIARSKQIAVTPKSDFANGSAVQAIDLERERDAWQARRR